MGSIPVPSTKTKGCPEVARLMTSFFVFHVFCFSMYERLITDIGYPGIYSLSVKRRGFTDNRQDGTIKLKYVYAPDGSLKLE